MNNKKIFTTSALTTLLAVSSISTNVHAQSKNFEGAYGTIGAGAIENEYKVNLNSPATTPAATAAGGVTLAVVEGNFVGFNNSATTILSRTAQALANKETNYIATASLGYNFALDEKFLIGLDISGRTGSGTQTITPSAHTISTVTKGTATMLVQIYLLL